MATKRNDTSTARSAEISRETKETRIRVSLDLDGSGKTEVNTGVGFFDHMLDLLTRHSLIDLSVEAKGDLEVDAHHTVEDVGIVIGQAIDRALGDKRGIYRYGWGERAEWTRAWRTSQSTCRGGRHSCST